MIEREYKFILHPIGFLTELPEEISRLFRTPDGEEIILGFAGDLIEPKDAHTSVYVYADKRTRFRMALHTPLPFADNRKPYKFTYKLPIPSGDRLEVETKITEQDFFTVYEQNRDAAFIKTTIRYMFGNTAWDVALFHTSNDPSVAQTDASPIDFIIAEVEFTDEVDFIGIPDLISRNLIGMIPHSYREYDNHFMADLKNRQNLLRKITGENDGFTS